MLYSALGGSLALGTGLGTVAPAAALGAGARCADVAHGRHAARRGAQRGRARRHRPAQPGLALRHQHARRGHRRVLATFFALEVLGNRSTLWARLRAECGRRALHRSRVPRRRCPSRMKRLPVETAQPAAAAPARFVLAASALVGFAFLLMELVWYRMLSPLLGGSTFTFGLILAVALLGIGLGGALYAIAGQRARRHAHRLCLDLRARGAVPSRCRSRSAIGSPCWRRICAHSRRSDSARRSSAGSWSSPSWCCPRRSSPAFSFRCSSRCSVAAASGVAGHTARAYALNTAGAIVGSLAGGFGLHAAAAPRRVCGSSSCCSWPVLSLVALVVQHRRAVALGPRHSGSSALRGRALRRCSSRSGRRPPGATAAWGSGRSGLDAPTRNALLDADRQHRRQQIVWEGDGVESSVAHLRHARRVLRGERQDPTATSAPMPARRCSAGCIGAALKPDVRTACVIGLGTGCTAGWLGGVPEIERVDAMELEPAVLHMARVCALANHARARQSQVPHPARRRARDAHHHARSATTSFSASRRIPIAPGIASLFTTEFYETAARAAESRRPLPPMGAGLRSRGRRDPHGARHARRASFRTWKSGRRQTGDLLLVASAEPRAWNIAALRARWQTEPFKTATQRIWGVDSAEGFLAHFAAGPELARRLAAMPGARSATPTTTRCSNSPSPAASGARRLSYSGDFRAAADLGATRPDRRGLGAGGGRATRDVHPRRVSTPGSASRE